MNFEERLALGNEGEEAIAQWLIDRGYFVLPAYRATEDGKGAMVHQRKGALRAPDLLVFTWDEPYWIECKYKASGASWWKIGGCWEAGIPKTHYDDYRKLGCTTLPVLVYMLIRAANEGDPQGLYAFPIDTPISHEYGESVWFRIDKMRKLAELEDVL